MLGNVVPQLHVHVIARFTTDEAWPKPVWGIGARTAYDADALRERIDALAHGVAAHRVITPTLEPLGEGALLIRLGDRIDDDINDAAIALAESFARTFRCRASLRQRVHSLRHGSPARR